MRNFGYCRISNKKQNIERQERNIKEYDSSAIIYRETYTGTKFQGRAELDRLLYGKRRAQPGDTIIFDSVSRMSRNSAEGFALYEELFNAGINLVFLKEPYINTDTYRQAMETQIQVAIDSMDRDIDELMDGIIKALNKYIMRLAAKQIHLAFDQAEKEVEDLHQRTREGIETARRNGKQVGQPTGAKLTTQKSIDAKAGIIKYNKAFNGMLNNEETWKHIGISKMTFYKYKSELLTNFR